MKLKAWLQLLRVPNLFTVPGDPLVGFSLACTAGFSIDCWFSLRPYLISFTSLLFYCSGLLQNDYFDREEDLRERPYRPIPSGRVHPRTVILVSLLFAAVAMVMAFSLGKATGYTSLALMTTITVYNGWAKRKQIIGAVSMGICRGWSLLLGAAALGGEAVHTPAVVISAVSLTLFVASVTHIAAGETRPYRFGSMRWAPLATLFAWFIGVLLVLRPLVPFPFLVFVVLCVASAFWTFQCGSFLRAQAPPSVTQKTIGRFIHGLLLVQATMIGVSGYPGGAVLLLLLVALPVSRISAKRFYAS